MALAHANAATITEIDTGRIRVSTTEIARVHEPGLMGLRAPRPSWLAWAGWLGGWPIVGVAGAVIAGVCLGFLIHNRPPAQIFVGDVGSAVLGFTIAMLPLLSGSADPRLPLVALLFVWPFVCDTFLPFARRLWAGNNVLEATFTNASCGPGGATAR